MILFVSLLVFVLFAWILHLLIQGDDDFSPTPPNVIAVFGVIISFVLLTVNFIANFPTQTDKPTAPVTTSQPTK